MRINEIFLSLQGEGVYTGVPTVFIRLAGCNLVPHCKYCDTGYAQSPNSGEGLLVQEVVSRVSKLAPYYRQLICITGGEPLWQGDELEELVSELKRGGYATTIETNGSFKPPRWYSKVDSWNADIKCPSSGVCGVSKEDWLRIRFCDQIKFVVGTKEDLDFTKSIISRHKADSPIMLVSPMLPVLDGEDQECFIANRKFLQEVWNFCIENRVRWSFQNHKIAWGNKKGV